MRKTRSALLLAGLLAGCATAPGAPPMNTYSTPNGSQVVATVTHLPNDIIAMDLHFERTPRRFGVNTNELAAQLSMTEPAPANAACAPKRAERLDSVYDESREARISHWRCV